MPYNFALIGAGGYVAGRHLRAIRDTGNRIVAATDPHDAVGHLDQFGFDVRFFPEIERFDRHLEKLRRGAADQRVHYISICSPNYLHDAHCRLALRVGADAICEKPLVINPWNLDALQNLERETGRRISTVLQLRLHPRLIALRDELRAEAPGRRHDVMLTYVTARGAWYHVSWKGVAEKSGGIATNIGIHFFDLLLWLFGDARECAVHVADARRMAGALELEHARVRWFLSVDPADLPWSLDAPGAQVASAPKTSSTPLRTTFRSINVDGQELEFTDGFADLHTRVYEQILAGQGFGIADARPSIELVHRIRTTAVSAPDEGAHPLAIATAARQRV